MLWIQTKIVGYLCVYLCSLAWVYGKKFEGVLDSSSDWSFIARFCFLSQNGDMQYSITYPLNFYPDNSEIGYDLLLYYDDKWSDVYGGAQYKNCSKKIGILHRELGQILPLTSRDPESGCKLLIEKENGSSYLQVVMPWEQLYPDATTKRSWHCEGTRSFSTIRDRWWYFAIASCGNPAGLSNVKYSFLFHNDPENPFKREFSADEFGILESCILFAVLIQIIVVLSIYVAAELSELNFLHLTYKLYFWSLLIFDLSNIFLLAGYAHLSLTGYELRGILNTSYALNAVSTIIFICLLLLLAKGYTVTHGRLAGVVQVVIATIVILLAFLYAVLFFYEIAVFDPAKVLYLYQSPGGFGICAVRVGVWIYFAYACFRTIHHHKSKADFYYTFFTVYTVWFFAFPIFVLLGSAVLEKWVRLKIVTIIEMSITLLAHVVILGLMWPTHANRFFPFHVRVAQIGTIDDPDEQSDDEQQAGAGSLGESSVRRQVGRQQGPSDWNIFTGTWDGPPSASGLGDGGDAATATGDNRANTYSIFSAAGSGDAASRRRSSGGALGPRFSEIYGSDQL